MTGATRAIAAALAVLLVGGATTAVRAQTIVQTQNPNAFSPGSANAAPHKTLQLDANGRWTLKLDMDPPVGQQSVDLKDVQAGAFFHITPSLRVGGSVGLGDREADPERLLPQDTETPRVHVETKFKF